jgi:hypothetical protein
MGPWSAGTVVYDPVNHLKIATSEMSKDDFLKIYERSPLFTELVARGQLWECWNTPITDQFRIV